MNLSNNIDEKLTHKSVNAQLFKGTIIIILISLLAKLSSFISEAILASYLGTSYQSDAYYMVSSIQMVIYPMLSVGIWKVFLPVYKEKIAKNENNDATILADKVITLFTIISIISVVLLFIFSDNIVEIVAPGFSSTAKELCSLLVKISSPMYIFIIAAAVYSAMLQCHNKFLGSQIREVASHVPTIISAIFFYQYFGVYALAVALVVGGCFRLLVELPFVDWGYKYKPVFHFQDPELKRIFRKLPSALISEGVTQVNTLIDKIMASSLPVGSVSALNYGNKLTNVFSGLFSSAIATALYPQIVELVTLDGKDQLNKLVTKIVNIFCILVIPVSIACFLFSDLLVSVVFERGAFNSTSSGLTSGVFGFYSIGLFFVACNTVLTNVFYGYGDTKTPMHVSSINLVVNVVGNFFFIRLLGVKGLALSTSISSFIAFFIMFLYIKKYITLNRKYILKTFLIVVIAASVACSVSFVLTKILCQNIYIKLCFATIVGVLIYLILMRLFKVTEINDLIRLIKNKVIVH